MYRELVRPGGLIGFHDVWWDYWHTRGKGTEACVGEVPRYWAGLREQGLTHELIHKPDQGGGRIGSLIKDSVA
jgi:hypothetical protein